MSSCKPSIIGLHKAEISTILENAGQPKYRVDQVIDWVYQKRATSFAEMSNLPQALRETLEDQFSFLNMEKVSVNGSKDTTQKFLFRLDDGRYVETVLIPANPALYSEKSDRRTACVSSQVGCAYGCKFCASGLAGFTRNLTVDEIVGQLLLVEKVSGERINNIVFMGMGEPLANLKNLTAALDVITAEWGIGIGARKITVSTSGLAPQIEKLADKHQQIRLAISLHGATDDVRDKIMPVNSKWNIDTLFSSLRVWNQKKKQKITFEYILIKDVNDAIEQAQILGKRAAALNAKVNLIPYNTVEGLDWERPTEEHCKKFRNQVSRAGVTTTLRLEKGHDINAACGQLRLKQETEEGIITAPIKLRK